MSIISGFPSNAKIAREMYDMKLISKNDIQKIILFSHFSNPLFIISMVNEKALLILAAHYLGNFIIGFIVRNKYISNAQTNKIKESKINLSQTLSNSINSSMQTLLFILGTIVTFSIISSIIDLPIFNIVLELSQGLNYISTFDVTLKVKTILLGSLLSFGGICIHFQVYGILSNLNIKYLPYLLSRLSHSLLTALIIFIFY